MSFRLPKTSEALSQHGANIPFGLGSHLESSITTGDSGVFVGEVPFDPSQHDVSDIDFSSTEEMITGDFHVQEIIPERPMAYSVIVDNTDRAEAEIFSKKKGIPKNALANALTEDVMSIGDRAINEDVVGERRKTFATQAKEAMGTGLVFGISDFVGFDPNSDMRGMVAIKVNHLLEREIPQGVGFVSLGGSVEINTNNPDQVARANAEMQAIHERTVEGLEKAGAQVVSVVVDPRVEHGFDVAKADQDIANAIEQLAK